MTTLPTPIGSTQPVQAMTRVPAVAPVGGGGGATSTATVDPIKLVKKYKWLLLWATLLGAALGVAAHYALLKIYPRWRSEVFFETSPPSARIVDTMSRAINVDELNRFMQTEARIMVSDRILRQVVEDPQILTAKAWCKPFLTNAGTIDNVKAARELKEDVDARVVPNTFLIQLTMTHTHPLDAKIIVGLIREKYLELLAQRGRARNDDMTKAVSNAIQALDTRIKAVQTARDQLIRNKDLDSASDAVGATQEAVRDATQRIGETIQDLQRLRKLQEQYEAELRNPAGPQVGDDIIAEAEENPVVRDLKSRISSIEGNLQTRILDAGREHRDVKTLQSQLDGFKQTLETTKRDTINKLFNARVEEVRKSVQQLESTLSELNTQREENKRRLTTLQEARQQLDDYKAELAKLQDQKADAEIEFQQVMTVARLDSANRVTVSQEETVPTVVSFPKLKLMIPAGILSVLGLTAGLLFVRELLDQRIKSPSDVFLIPKMRILGWLPSTDEDPTRTGPAETIFRDHPTGIVAEGFRKIRATIAKRLSASGHRSILFFSGMPESGATSVATNTAMAFASSDKRVLLVDANFRRPDLHRVFGLQEYPGFADALATGRDLRQLVQATTVPNLDLLSAGGKEHRVYERLATQSVTDILDAARNVYDIIIIDAAPFVVAGDCMALAHRVDATVLVVRATVETRGLVSRIRNELAEVRSEFLGVLVNAVKSAPGGYLKGNIKTASGYQES